MERTLFESRPIGEGEWSAPGRERFRNDNGSVFGGYVVGLMLATLMREPSRQGTPIAITCTFLAPVANGPITIATRCLRAARALAFWQADVRQGDDTTLCAQAVVTFAERPETARLAGWKCRRRRRPSPSRALRKVRAWSCRSIADPCGASHRAWAIPRRSSGCAKMTASRSITRDWRCSRTFPAARVLRSSRDATVHYRERCRCTSTRRRRDRFGRS